MANKKVRSRFKPSHAAAAAYLLIISLAESLTVFADARYGFWVHLIVFTAMVFLGMMDRSRPQSRLWLTLALAPLIRMVSLATPLAGFRLLYWYLLTGVPIFFAAFAVVRYLRLPRQRLALQMQLSPGQLLVGASGLALGYVEYLILRPQPLIPEWNAVYAIEALLILTVFTGLVEEIVFRGLMQHTAEWVLGKTGVVYIALIFSVLHLGYRSIADMLFVFAVALYFGFYVRRTRSILGVTLAHGLTNVALFLIFPFLLGPTPAAGEDVYRGVLSPPLPTPTVTPTPFRPYTPTPFLPDQPTPIESVTPSPETSLQFDTQAVGFLKSNTIRTPALATRTLYLRVSDVQCGVDNPGYAGWSGRSLLVRHSGPQLIFVKRTPVRPRSDWRFN
ncbi:MAG: CPBP family intramembrane metalloprotease [Anaerolineales bacterium]|nr:CPBP family intramembrane metalloprotease [Anaerolineales bacterium]